MSEMMDDDLEWQPPTEAEMKIIQARRERSDIISKRMADYMLRGYKMLGSTCLVCGVILLQDKHGENYCIACQELDTDANKDDPVINTEAARSQILEGTIADADGLPATYSQSQQPVMPVQGTSAVAPTPATLTSSGVSSQLDSANLNLNFVDSVDTLCQKIKWATDELKKSLHVDHCINLCQLIKSSADAIQSLKKIS